MTAADHMTFIVAAYAAAAAVVGGLIGWVISDYRAQVRRLAELEASGVARRSAPQPGAPMQAREDA